MIWVADPIVFTKLRYLEPSEKRESANARSGFRAVAYACWMSAKILESKFPPVLVCSTAACIIASISIFPRGFSMGTTEPS